MKLRKLKTKDAPYMLEWMHDVDVVQHLNNDFGNKTIEDCRGFIIDSENDLLNLNLAIVDNKDEYMGTVSLKNIDIINGVAEFAIAIRKCAMGKGYSKMAIERIIRIGIAKYGLKMIYWCVNNDNKRAIRFYEKNGYHSIEMPNCVCGYEEDEIRSLMWFGIEM